MRTIIALCVVAVLTACAGQPFTSTPKDPANPTLGDKIVADLNAAEAIACAKTSPSDPNSPAVDPLGCSCYPALLMVLQSPNLVPQSPVVGAVSGLEASRIVTNNLNAGVPLAVKQACGGLYLDERQKVLTIAALIGILKP